MAVGPYCFCGLRDSWIGQGQNNNLIQKAVGWALREVGKIDSRLLRDFLKKNLNKTSRTTLRYAIEKFTKTERKRWLSA